MSASRRYGRDLEAAGGPGAGEHGDLPDGGGGADEAGEDGGGGVAADGLGPTPLGVVGDGATGQPGDASEAVGDAFDEAESGGRGAEGDGQQVGQEGGGISWLTSARKLAVPMPATPGPSQRSCFSVGGCSWRQSHVARRPATIRGRGQPVNVTWLGPGRGGCVLNGNPTPGLTFAADAPWSGT